MDPKNPQTIQPESSKIQPSDQAIESQSTELQHDLEYFTKLATILIILGAIWLGSRFYGNEEKPLGNIYQKTPEIAAAALPGFEKGILSPLADFIPPIRNWEIPDPELEAASIFAFDAETGKILFEKNADEIRPIASLSKIITALVVIKKIGLKEEISISQKAIDTYGKMGNLVANEIILAESLLQVMLIESSNDAAVALAEEISQRSRENFSDLMNKKSDELNLVVSRFSDPSGLSNENISSAKEIAKIIQAAAEYPILREITTIKEIDTHSADGKLNHHLTNSNKLLKKYPEILIGKTGYIDEAGQCMALAIRPPKRGEADSKDMIINVILGSPDRFFEMEKLILWEKEAFLW